MVRDVSLVMKRNHKYLVDNLKNVKSLLEELFTKRVISSEHLQYFNVSSSKCMNTKYLQKGMFTKILK